MLRRFRCAGVTGASVIASGTEELESLAFVVSARDGNYTKQYVLYVVIIGLCLAASEFERKN